MELSHSHFSLRLEASPLNIIEESPAASIIVDAAAKFFTFYLLSAKLSTRLLR